MDPVDYEFGSRGSSSLQTKERDSVFFQQTVRTQFMDIVPHSILPAYSASAGVSLGNGWRLVLVAPALLLFPLVATTFSHSVAGLSYGRYGAARSPRSGSRRGKLLFIANGGKRIS